MGCHFNPALKVFTSCSYLQLLLDPLILLCFSDASLFAAEVNMADTLIGELGAGLCVVLVVFIVLVLSMTARRRWHHRHGGLQLLLGFLQVLLG